MARGKKNKNELVKCEYCGEWYSITYKHCPFCNEDGTGTWEMPAEEEYEKKYEEDRSIRPAGGRRLAGGGRSVSRDEDYDDLAPRPRFSPASIIGVVLSLVLIAAAVGIMVSVFRSITGQVPNPTPTPAVENTVKPTVTPDVSAEPTESADPDATPDVSVEPTETPDVEPTIPVTPDAPTDFKLNASDLTFDAAGQIYDMRVIFTPSDANAEVTWSSSNPDVASVTWNGRVTAISKGTVTITAKVEGLGEKSCIFRCNFSGTATPSTSGNGNSAGLSLNREDFTLSKKGETWRLTVSGTESAVTWSSSNESVATVGSDGTVTAVGKGTCTVTAEVDGVKLKCIVRCNISG